MAEMERMTAEEVVRHLLEDEGGADLVRDSLRWLVQQLMEAEVSEQIGAAHGERRSTVTRVGARSKCSRLPSGACDHE
jgi:transposase-like protein